MKFFGIEVRWAPGMTAKGSGVLSPVDSRGSSPGWWPWRVFEPFAGAFQRDIEWTTDTVLAHHAVYACVTLIANDIGKLRHKLVEQSEGDIWQETSSAAFSPVLRGPNRYQNHIQFKQWWMTSKLLRGNMYALKQRDERGIVKKLYVLDATTVVPKVAPDGSIFYQLGRDNINGLQEVGKLVPASEIIHDRMNCLFHPLVGISPIFACGLAANMGQEILENSSNFFGNGSNPSGVLTAPATIPQATADRIKEHWDKEYSGTNSGKVAVLGDGLSFEPMRMTAEDSQTIEQLKFTAEMVCSAFHMPPFKIGVGPQPTVNNAELLNQIYYTDCLQSLIEEYELAMDDGLGLGEANPKTDNKVLGVELDLDALLRMDTAAQIGALKEGVGAGIIAPNEARRKINLKKVKGGDTPYLQQQNYSLSALDDRDKAGPPPSSPGDRRGGTPAPDPAPPAPPSAPTPTKEEVLEVVKEDDLRREEAAALISMRAKTWLMGQAWSKPAPTPPAAPPIHVHLTLPGGSKKTIEMINSRGEKSVATMSEEFGS